MLKSIVCPQCYVRLNCGKKGNLNGFCPDHRFLWHQMTMLVALGNINALMYIHIGKSPHKHSHLTISTDPLLILRSRYHYDRYADLTTVATEVKRELLNNTQLSSL